ncbi:hypothetical protein M0Q97_06985 [Candidatus Dojkabacteria bacterium]|jgi:hypothetical protein|nr:hypothetical protein [Candidatus Dojkabacteria bacterium]
MKYLKTFENLSESIEVWRGSRSSEQKIHDGMFFTTDSSYAKNFGHYIEKYLIYPKKTLDLFKYNKIIKEKLQKDNFLNLHTRSIADIWAPQIDYLYNSGLEDLVDKFEKELEDCDSIYGSDSGFDNSKVYYIKKKENVKKI